MTEVRLDAQRGLAFLRQHVLPERTCARRSETLV